MRLSILAACIFVAACLPTAAAQTAPPIEPSKPQDQTPGETLPSKYRVVDASFDILRDEKAIWKDMLQIRRNEMKWLVPIAAANAVAFSTDAAAFEEVPTSRRILEASHAVSSFGAPYPLFIDAASMYLIGRYTGNLRLRETGILGTQALVHSIIITGALESATNRRPPNGSGEAEFWSGGRAWPSGHASMFWALSTVVGEQYRDRPWVRFTAYSLATAVSVSRFTGGVHFPSDALASSVVGYAVGRWVVHRHGATRK